MIAYESGDWAIGFAFQKKGSVVPKAMCWATPLGVCAVLIFWAREQYFADVKFSSLDTITNGYSVVLGFLLVYRAQTAYTRIWDGATNLYALKGVWFNVASSLFSFCTVDPAKAAVVQKFQHQLVKLLSLLYASALQAVAGPGGGDCFEVLDWDGLETQKVEWVQSQHDKLEVIMQWVQQLVVEMHRKSIIDIPPPILSRVFQDLGNGMLDVANAKRIVKFPFPFPYAQMITLMLLGHGAVTIFVAGLSMSTWYFAFFYAFTSSGTLWAINYIAIEIEMPFGRDANDLPLGTMMKSMNDCLVILLHPYLQRAPSIDAIDGHHMTIHLVPWTIGSDLRVESYSSRGSLTYEVHQKVAVEEPRHEPANELFTESSIVTAPLLLSEQKLVEKTSKDVTSMESERQQLVTDLRACSETIAHELRQLSHILTGECRPHPCNNVQAINQHPKHQEATPGRITRPCRMEKSSMKLVNPIGSELQMRAQNLVNPIGPELQMRARMVRYVDESVPRAATGSPPTFV